VRAPALLLLAATSCTHAQASKIHRAGEVTLAAGLIGILATVAVAEAIPSEHSDILRAGVVFVPISLFGALAYIAVDSEVNQPRERALTPEERSFEAAMTIARDAKHAARRGDCAEVQAIEPRVRELNERVYRRFLHEDVIRRCLAPTVDVPAPAPVPVPLPAP
jgi:CRISPR/Cas system-associated protein Csm6